MTIPLIIAGFAALCYLIAELIPADLEIEIVIGRRMSK